MKVEWTSLALRDKDDIFLYIAADDIDAAFRVDALFDEAAGRLAEFPYLGHPGDQGRSCRTGAIGSSTRSGAEPCLF